ncbi:MAG: DUF4301 family protein [Elusimicrobiota bacterium]|jgi:hypothetical protein
MLTERDVEAVREHGIPEAELRRQLEFFQKPPAYAELDRPCTPGDGILTLDDETLERLIERAERSRASGRMSKFVPASGRASRMFHALQVLRGREQAPDDKEAAEAQACLRDVSRFAFAQELRKCIHDSGEDLDAMVRAGRYAEIAEFLLGPKGLGYAELPKALLGFHLSGEGSRTAFEEHLIEAASYVRDRSEVCRVHFTIPPDSRRRFEQMLAEAAPRHEQRLGVRFEVGFSAQKLSTDTAAVTPEGEVFRREDGRPLFWAGGHGALLDNLNSLKGDIVFIKNVDNVAPDKLKEQSRCYKLALAGMLIELEEKLHDLLARIYSKAADETALDDAMRFAQKRLMISKPAGWEGFTRELRRTYLIERLDRPLRVCGVVPNTGEAGGGPFWVHGQDGVTPQIVERASVSPDEKQKAVFAAATHFNPVDVVCALRDYLGEPFNLRRFQDQEAVFISEKSFEGKTVKVLEHPGLWNGGMARWITLFVEVPLWTFQPVKTLSDLLREGHRS